jgi:YVTN family beta-propeller protein
VLLEVNAVRSRWCHYHVLLPALFVAVLCSGAVAWVATPHARAVATDDKNGAVDRSPVDLLLTADETRLITVNQTSNTVSLVDINSEKVLAEIEVGKRPSALVLTPNGKQVLVTGTVSGDLTLLALEGDTLTRTASIPLGFEPRGVAVAPEGKLAYVALTTAHQIAVVDLAKREIVERIAVGKWPRYLALTADGKRLAVGVNGDGGVTVVDTATRKLLFQEEFMGLNLGQMQISADGKYVYFPWMVYRNNPITPANIREGWVLASRIARVRLDESARREAMSLDPKGKAIADPHGLALSPDEKTLVSAASGTHELLVYNMPALVFQDYGGPGDHIRPELLKDDASFYRIPLGGRPMNVRYSRDGRRVFVANYLLNSVQIVDVPERKIVHTLDLGGAREPSLARQGETIFYDGTRSLDQWYSCNSCHYEGHTNAVTMDTRSDGRRARYKVVRSLRNVTHAGPWHGWQKDLDEALAKSLTDTMQSSKAPAADDVKALRAFFETLIAPPSPYRLPDGRLSEAAKRGEQVFLSEKAGCYRCHGGDYFTDGKAHNVGTGSPGDLHKDSYGPPSLLGVYDRLFYLHDGRAKSLEDVLKRDHNPAKVSGRGELSEQEVGDLLEYLKAL